MGASGQCIAVVSGKGGTGKTSFVAGVGADGRSYAWTATSA